MIRLGRAWNWLIHEERRPTVLSLLVAGIAWIWFPSRCFERVVADVLPMAVNVAALLASMMAISHAILLALMEKPVMIFLKKQGYYGTVVDYQRSSFSGLLLFIAASLIVTLLKAIAFQADWYLTIAPAALGYFGAIAWFRTARQMNLMFKMLAKADRA